MATPEPTNILPPRPGRDRADVMGRPASLPDDADLAAGYELSDIGIRAILRVGLSILIFTVVVFGVVTAFQTLLTGNVGDFTPPASGIADPPASEVPYVIESRAATGQEWQQVKREQEVLLSGYARNPETGAVTIPIERAMELLLAEDAFPVRAESAASELQDDGLGLPTDSNGGRSIDRMVAP